MWPMCVQWFLRQTTPHMSTALPWSTTPNGQNSTHVWSTSAGTNFPTFQNIIRKRQECWHSLRTSSVILASDKPWTKLWRDEVINFWNGRNSLVRRTTRRRDGGNSDYNGWDGCPHMKCTRHARLTHTQSRSTYSLNYRFLSGSIPNLYTLAVLIHWSGINYFRDGIIPKHTTFGEVNLNCWHKIDTGDMATFLPQTTFKYCHEK